ncbi:MAG: hypothetical protein R3B13_41195 [Polyangiaceae bacterium]
MAEGAPKDEDISTTLRNLTPPSEDPVSEKTPTSAVASEPLTKKRGGESTSDTLLSAPVDGKEAEASTAAREIARQDERSSELERRLDQLEARVKLLELRQPSGTPRWLIWVLFLFGLALAFQLSRQL